MTATADILGNLVEGSTYQLDTAPDGEGGTRWDLFLYQRVEDVLGWHQIETRTTATPPNGHYRDAGRGWLRSLGHDPDAMDIVMILPDGVERLRPGG